MRVSLWTLEMLADAGDYYAAKAAFEWDRLKKHAAPHNRLRVATWYRRWSDDFTVAIISA